MLRKPIASAKMFRVGGHFEQCSGAGLEQEGEQDPLVLPHQRHQCMRNAEDEVEVADRKQFALTGAQPLLAGVGLAFWTVAIAAGAVRDGFIPAASALIAMAAERSSSAAFNRGEYFELRPASVTHDSVR